MLSKEENELITRVGRGTPMGETMRRYWMPALISWELPEADCPPVRLRLLGEDLVAFRDTSGRVGVLDENCPHRLASLWLGRNEENGLRCVYHGWKFDVDGACTEQMNEPEPFAHKVRVTAYPAVELGGVIWVYMGPAEHQPPLPKFEYTQADDDHRGVSKVVEECNWLQAFEGGIDTSHAPILHRALRAEASHLGIPPSAPFVQGRAPVLEVETTDYGYRYLGIRKMGADRQYVRGYHFVMPFTQLRPGDGVSADKEAFTVSGHHWVPIDDENTMVWNFNYTFGEAPFSPEEREHEGGGNSRKYVDWDNGFKAQGNRSNNWMIDRAVQKVDTFTGIPGINAQDRAVQESMGVIVDRSREHLGPADKAVIAARRLLLQAVSAVKEGGAPLGANAAYYSIRATQKVFAADITWQQELMPAMYPERTLVAAGR